MRRKRISHKRSHFSRPARLLVLVLLAAVLFAAAGALFSGLFQPVISARGTMLFLPGV